MERCFHWIGFQSDRAFPFLCRLSLHCIVLFIHRREGNANSDTASTVSGDSEDASPLHPCTSRCPRRWGTARTRAPAPMHVVVLSSPAPRRARLNHHGPWPSPTRAPPPWHRAPRRRSRRTGERGDSLRAAGSVRGSMRWSLGAWVDFRVFFSRGVPVRFV